MVAIEKPKTVIPDICPECGENLHHVNALDSEAGLYMVFCRNLKCKWCKNWRLAEL